MRKPCYDKQDANKGAPSKQEEKKLMDYVRIPQAAGLLRCSKSCRWVNYISSAIKPGSFTEDEEDLIVKLHALLGERWSLIAGRLPGRTAHEVKNYWNSHLSMKLIRMGIDPKNHRLSQNNVFNRPQRHKHKEERHSSSPQRDDDGAANSPEDDSFCMSSELNLDLTLCLHSSQHPTWQNEESPESITHGK